MWFKVEKEKHIKLSVFFLYFTKSKIADKAFLGPKLVNLASKPSQKTCMSPKSLGYIKICWFGKYILLNVEKVSLNGEDFFFNFPSLKIDFERSISDWFFEFNFFILFSKPFFLGLELFRLRKKGPVPDCIFFISFAALPSYRQNFVWPTMFNNSKRGTFQTLICRRIWIWI